MSGEPRWNRALISGAGSGIGLRLSEMLRARGVAVSAFDLRFGPDAERRLTVDAAAPPATLREVDVTDGVALGGAVEEAVRADGAPNLAVNCAGIQASAAFDELPEDRFRSVIEVNLIGSRNFAAAVLPELAPSGQLALIASLAGIVPNYGYAAYSASKFGVVGLAGCLRLEYEPRGIAVSVVCPPEVETPMVDEERRTGNAVGLEMKKFSGTLQVDDACEQILDGLSRRRSIIVPGRRAGFTRRLAQFAPGLMRATSDRMVRRELAKRRSPEE